MSKKASHVIALNKVVTSANVPDEVMILPEGEFTGRDGRVWRNTNPQGVIDAFADSNMDLPVDIEHATQLKGENGENAAAVGWVTSLYLKDGALWGSVEWTQRGGWIVAERSYRYLSPVFLYDATTLEISHLVSLALTNQPNLHLQALNRRETLPPQQTETETMDKHMKAALCRWLDLAEEASDQSILDAVEALKKAGETALNRAENPSLEKFVPRADHDKLKGDLETAQNRLKEIDEGEIEALVDAAIKAGKIAPASKDYHLAACRTHRKAFEDFIATAPKLDVAQNSQSKAQPPEKDGAPSLSKEDRALCRQLGIEEADYLKTLEEDRNDEQEAA